MGYTKDGVPHNGTSTSRAAAESIDAGTLRGLVYREIAKAVAHGRTCDEVEVKLVMRHQTASARIKELFDRKLVFGNGQRRRTRSGRFANVYVIKEFATHGAVVPKEPKKLTRVQRMRIMFKKNWPADLAGNHLDKCSGCKACTKLL